MKKNILYLKILLHPFILVWDTYNLPINYCRLFNTKLVNSLVFYSDLKTFYLLQMYTPDFMITKKLIPLLDSFVSVFFSIKTKALYKDLKHTLIKNGIIKLSDSSMDFNG